MTLRSTCLMNMQGLQFQKKKKSNEMIKEQLGKAEIIDFDPLVLHDSLTKYNNLITKRKLVFNYRIYQPKSFRTNINLHNYLLQLKSYTLLLAPLKKKKKKKQEGRIFNLLHQRMNVCPTENLHTCLV